MKSSRRSCASSKKDVLVVGEQGRRSGAETRSRMSSTALASAIRSRSRASTASNTGDLLDEVVARLPGSSGGARVPADAIRVGDPWSSETSGKFVALQNKLVGEERTIVDDVPGHEHVTRIEHGCCTKADRHVRAFVDNRPVLPPQSARQRQGIDYYTELARPRGRRRPRRCRARPDRRPARASSKADITAVEVARKSATRQR